MSKDAGAEQSSTSESVEICHRKVPKSVMVQVFQCLDKPTLKVVSEVSRSFNQLSKHPSLCISAMYSGPNNQLPELQAVIPFPPPAVLQTTLPNVTTVNPAPQYSTVLPQSTQVILPVLPETVPLIAQVPDVVTNSGTAEGSTGDLDKPAAKGIVQISQILPGYAPSYAQEYVPTEVNSHSFSTFANTISFNVSRYPTLVEMTDSKDYEAKQRGYSSSGVKKDEGQDSKVTTEDALKGVKAGGLNMTTSNDTNLEYVPAEYFRGVANNCIQTVSASGSVSFVKPDVLASGRVLTYMTPVPSQSLTTTSTTAPNMCTETTTYNPSDPVQITGHTNGQNGHNGHNGHGH